MVTGKGSPTNRWIPILPLPLFMPELEMQFNHALSWPKPPENSIISRDSAIVAPTSRDATISLPGSKQSSKLHEDM